MLAELYMKGPLKNRHNQLGDPSRAGEIVVETSLRPDAPFRLLLGSDAVQAAKETLETRLRELQLWMDTSRQSDFSENSFSGE